jgi:hypothetical protein
VKQQMNGILFIDGVINAESVVECIPHLCPHTLYPILTHLKNHLRVNVNIKLYNSLYP